MGDVGKVVGVGGASVLIGGVFPLFLFEKLGVGNLISSAAGTTAVAPFAITVFAMIAIMIIGIGALLSKVDISQNRMATNMMWIFGAVFIFGFITTVVLSFVAPEVKVYVRFPEYSDNADFFKQLKLSAYVDDNTRHDGTRIMLSPEGEAICRGENTPIEFGIVGIRAVEDRLTEIKRLTDSTCFPEASVPAICTLDALKSGPTCKSFAQAHRVPAGD